MTFDIVVVSVTSVTFDRYRAALQEALGVDTETAIAKAAGIGPVPPPIPASRMASYALHLFRNLCLPATWCQIKAKRSAIRTAGSVGASARSRRRARWT